MNITSAHDIKNARLDVPMVAPDGSIADITITVEMVGPELAREYLGRNANNRNIRRHHVIKYLRDISSGLWLFSGDPIRFDEDGDLIDGQHRLTAISEAGDSVVPILVVRGLPVRVKRVLDQGSKRTSSDQLKMAGYRNTANLGAVISTLIDLESGNIHSRRCAPSAPAIEDWAEAHPDEVESVASRMSIIRKASGGGSALGAAYIVLSRIDAEAADKFFEDLAGGYGLKGDPVKALEGWIGSHKKAIAKDALAATFVAWNARRAGRRLTIIRAPQGGTWTVKNFPVPR